MSADGSAPIYVVWEITLRCDLSCGHCGSRAGKPRTDELRTEEALDVVRQLAEMGAREVTLIGGEAYLRADWTDIARAIVARGMRCTMTTGGRGVTPERARMAKDAGMSAVSVSLDGMNEAHDRQRGLEGSFDAALAALENLRAAGVTIDVNTQLNRISFPHLDALVDLLIAKQVRGWQVQLTVPMGRAADRPEWLFQPYELLDVYPKLAALAERARAGGVMIWPANNIGYFGPHEAILRGSGVDSDFHWSGCPAGTRAMGIESDGTIKGCPSLPTAEWGGGSSRETPLQKIWDETKELRYTRDRTAADLWGFCKDCYYADGCRAGCTWTSHVFFGKPGNNPYCHHRALEHDARGLRECLVQRKAAPGTPFDHGEFDVIVEAKDSDTPDVRATDDARVRLPIV
ncbi:GDL motif peptide-associated radical SAM/SPASM maturase [soil metagenome]